MRFMEAVVHRRRQQLITVPRHFAVQHRVFAAVKISQIIFPAFARIVEGIAIAVIIQKLQRFLGADCSVSET